MLSAAAAEAAFNPASEPACYVPQKFVPDPSSNDYKWTAPSTYMN